jgi:hypothetical protein
MKICTLDPSNRLTKKMRCTTQNPPTITKNFDGNDACRLSENISSGRTANQRDYLGDPNTAPCNSACDMSSVSTNISRAT